MTHWWRELAQQIRFWGAQGIVRSIHYALLGTWGRLRRAPERGPFDGVGQARGLEPTPGGAHVPFDGAELELRFLRPDLLRVTWRPGELPIPYALARTAWPEVELEIDEEEGGWRLRTTALRVELSRDGALRFFDGDGTVLRSERPPQRRAGAWLQRAPLQAGESLVGLGEHTGRLELRGTRRRLWNADPMASYGPASDPLYLNIPVLQSLQGEGGYLLFHENPYPAEFVFGHEIEARFEGGALRYYLAPGTPEHALERYAELTGRPPLPPRWALGYHQSRFSYRDTEEVREIADGFRAHGLPLGAIHLDIHYMDGFRVFTVDDERFPDLAALARELDERGVKLVAILDPGVKRDPDYRVYREGLEGDRFCRTAGGRVAFAPVWPGWSAFPDFTDPEVRRWWGAQYAVLLGQGIRGFWNDMNEPSMTALWGERTLARDIRHDLEGRGGDHHEAHNLYGLLMARAGVEGLRAQRPEERPWLLSRSGWAGIQRYAWSWTGDVSSDWPMLRTTVAMILGLGLSGMPYSGPDIGGFKGRITEEQYLRWFELATFLPFYRTHSAQSMAPREPWRFGPEALEVTRTLLELRTSLLPYLYTLAWEASRTGHPLVRPLFWSHPHDERLWGRDDAFLLGDDLLVAPVLGPGERERAVDLPPGRWIDFWNDEPHELEARVDAPLGRPPLFVRAGAVLPRAEGDHLALHLYPSAEQPGGGVLYGDAGDGYGAHRVDRFELTSGDGALTVRWREEGSYPSPYARVVLHVHGFQAQEIDVDGAKSTVHGTRMAVEPFREVRLVGR